MEELGGKALQAAWGNYEGERGEGEIEQSRTETRAGNSRKRISQVVKGDATLETATKRKSRA